MRRTPSRAIKSGESHYLRGRRYLLDVVEADQPPEVQISGNKTLRLQVRPRANRAKRRAVLDGWYRERIPQLIDQWTPRLGVEVADWRIKRMKTKWGSCSTTDARIWLNLELAKKSDRCLKYIVVHEMTHLLERNHNDRFKSLMTRHLPSWQIRRDELNGSPLPYGDWTY